MNLANQNPFSLAQFQWDVKPHLYFSFSFFPSFLPPQFTPKDLQLQKNMGGRSYRSRTQRKHFREGRENTWKRSKPDSEPTEQNPDGNKIADANPKPIWQSLVTESPNFEQYYKVFGTNLYV